MPTTIHDLLAQYAHVARDTREKGLLFERLTKAYLTTDPVWVDRFSEVWLWQDWPDRDGKPDTGIDLVAKERWGCRILRRTGEVLPPDPLPPEERYRFVSFPRAPRIGMSSLYVSNIRCLLPRSGECVVRC